MSILPVPAGAPGDPTCDRCGEPVIVTRSAATGWPLQLSPVLIETVYVRRGEQLRATAAAVGYRLLDDGSAVVACAPGPAGYAGAGDSYDVHRCPTVRPRLRLVGGGRPVRDAA